MIEISGLFVYPVKSCRGIALDEVNVGRRGFLHDREFLVVDETDAFLTQRNAPALATIETTLTPSDLVLSAPRIEALRVPLVSDTSGASTITREVQIFSGRMLADDRGDEAAEWFSSVLGRPCRLMQIGSSSVRRVRPDRIATPEFGADISFTDAFPTLLITEASLADLNMRLPHAIPMNRFRPNIVVRGASAFAEDTWHRVRISDVVFHCSAACLRCVITTTDQRTGERDGAEPLATLATFRRAPDGTGVMFGQYLVHSGRGRLRIGDALVTEQLRGAPSA